MAVALFGQAQSLIQSGPMNGYSEMREALVWVQTTEACEVELVYWPDSLPSAKMRSEPVNTQKSEAFTAKLIADAVEPGGRYGYSIYANGENQTPDLNLYFHTQELWQYRRDPPNFTIAAGSCAYINEPEYDRPGRGYGSNYRIFDKIADANPDMMLWLGDNVYMRPADWFTQTGIFARYTHTRSLVELQRLLRSTHHYAIWDDHDFGPNDSNRSFPHRDKTRKAFELFWGNNGYGVAGNPGITSAFQFNDVHFFLLDNRWNRTAADLKTDTPQVFGSEQIDWLIESLKYSRAPFKIVATGGQILNDAAVYENYANFEREREVLLGRIAEEGIKGVVFLTGDRHHAEMTKVIRQGIPIYEITTSPLTSGTHTGGDEATTNRVQGTLYNGHNFALLDISGERKNREMKVRVMTADGEEVWNRTISQREWYTE